MKPNLGPLLESILALEPADRVGSLAVYAGAVADAVSRGEKPSLVVLATSRTRSSRSSRTARGGGHDRMVLGEALSRLGDPRLQFPSDDTYWVTVEGDAEGPTIQVGKFAVTTAEWRRFVEEGGYENDEWWSDEGKAWRDSGEQLWPQLAADPEVAEMVLDNQPVVGVTYFEAQAYASSRGARLLSSAERRRVVRCGEKRPYPWGAPFGHGNANTREEVLGKPCAVGIYPADCTPSGVYDLAGNVAEWVSDEAGDLRTVHPGSWQQPSMAAWAKAVAMFPPNHRSATWASGWRRD